MKEDITHVTETEECDFLGYACDDCKIGRQRLCAHAYGYHFNVWGEGIGTPYYCPQKADPNDPDGLPW